MDVIGAGFGRTGTLSLRAALEQLGYGPCYHMLELVDHPEHAKLWNAAANRELSDWDRLFGDYRATVDWPGCAFWRELMEAYPEAKVILTVRDPQRWYESASVTIFRRPGEGRLNRLAMTALTLTNPNRFRTLRVIRKVLHQGTFDGDTSDKQHAIDVFNRHIREVKETVPADRLLVYELSQGWEPLCGFLGVEVPETPLPHLNESADFHTVIGKRIRRSMLADAAPAAGALAGTALLAGVALASRRRRTRVPR